MILTGMIPSEMGGLRKAQVDALIRQAEARLVEVDAALERVRDGTYGVCAVCGRAIPAGRLEARPTTTTCVEHA